MTETRGATDLRMVEISGEITSGMWDYNALALPGMTLPTAQVSRVSSIPYQGALIHSLVMSTLTGTYVETAGHMVEGAPLLDNIGIERFIRPAKVLRLPPADPCRLYQRSDFEAADPGIEEGDALLVDTGWGRRWNTPDYVTKAPAFAMSTLDWLVAQPFSILGIDTPVMECLWADKVDPPIESEIGKAILVDLYRAKQQMLLLAPLVNLDRIQTASGTLIALPIKVEGTCSTPSRAVFIEGLALPV